MSTTSYADAAKKALKPKSKLVGTTPIQSMFKQVVKALPDCSTAGCKHKAKFGYEAPALACSAHKLEGMHEISILKMNLQPTEPISAASILVSPPEILPSARVGELNESTESRVSSKDTRSPTTSDVLVDDIYHSGMQLNQMMIVRFNTGPSGHLDEALRKEVVQRFFLVKKRREKKTKLSVIKLNSGPTTVKVKCLANVNKPRKRIRKNS